MHICIYIYMDLNNKYIYIYIYSQCVAMALFSCGVLQCVAVQYIAVHCCVLLNGVAVCCNVLQWPYSVAACCSVLQCIAVCCWARHQHMRHRDPYSPSVRRDFCFWSNIHSIHKKKKPPTLSMREIKVPLLQVSEAQCMCFFFFPQKNLLAFMVREIKVMWV